MSVQKIEMLCGEQLKSISGGRSRVALIQASMNESDSAQLASPVRGDDQVIGSPLGGELAMKAMSSAEIGKVSGGVVREVISAPISPIFSSAGWIGLSRLGAPGGTFSERFMHMRQ